MGHKVNPKAFRIGPQYSWDSRWFAQGSLYSEYVIEDATIRNTLLKRLAAAGIVLVEIERSINKMNVILHVVRPGMVIGRGGTGLEETKKYLLSTIITHRKKQGSFDPKSLFKMDLKVEPVKEPNLNAYFVGRHIADQLAKRLPHKRVVHFALEKIMNAGAKGAKIILAGRIAGAEISRRETYKSGSIPLSTIRENIDFAAVPSLTKSGYIGVKVWICKKS